MPVEHDEWLAFARSLPRGRPRMALNKQVNPASPVCPCHWQAHTEPLPTMFDFAHPCLWRSATPCAAPQPLQLPACFSCDLL